jgi:UTP--glucose-1-phosphate uridylyltransferase
MTARITKAVVPVAGLGTRVMPLTLHQPKAMIGVVDRPIIHYVIDELIAGGIKNIILVISPNQPQFKTYLKYLKNKDPEWRKLKIKFNFVIQKRPWGNGDAIYAARKFIKNEPFVAAFGDDVLVDKTGDVSAVKNLIGFYKKFRVPMIILESVPKTRVSRYGVVKIKKRSVGRHIYKIDDVVEKPKPSAAPSNLTIVGRYILTPEIIKIIKTLYPVGGPLPGKEIWLADALKIYAQKGERLLGWRFNGRRFDGGSKIGILKAQAYFGTHHKELGPEFKKFLKRLV